MCDLRQWTHSSLPRRCPLSVFQLLLLEFQVASPRKRTQVSFLLISRFLSMHIKFLFSLGMTLSVKVQIYRFSKIFESLKQEQSKISPPPF